MDAGITCMMPWCVAPRAGPGRLFAMATTRRRGPVRGAWQARQSMPGLPAAAARSRTRAVTVTGG